MGMSSFPTLTGGPEGKLNNSYKNAYNGKISTAKMMCNNNYPW